MRIAILNEPFLTEGQMAELRRLGDVAVFPDTSTPAEAIERLEGAEIALVNCYVAPLTGDVLRRADTLRLLALNSTGYETVDLAAAAERGILVANAPGYATEAVAEHTVALMLAASRHVAEADAWMRKGPFEVGTLRPDYKRFLGSTLAGKTLGIVGLGAIGRRVALLGAGLGMRVIAWNRTPVTVPGVHAASLENVLGESDVLSLHVPIAPDTRHLIGVRELGLMKRSAIFVNTARGGVVDERALHAALSERKIAGAGLDVLEDWTPANPLLKLDNVVLTPHMAYYTREALEKLGGIMLENVRSFLEGKPTHIVHA